LQNFNATAENVSGGEITDSVNNWINENTNGLIPSISDNLSLSDLVLVNTLYLRTAWSTAFEEYATQEGYFKTLSGNTVKKDFMHQQDSFRYYEDENGKFIILPMKGGINAVFILGDIDNVIEKMSEAAYEEVAVTIPKFETETSLSESQLVDFCIARGAETAFTSDADFSLMSDDSQFFISDIIQKTKIKVDEDGIEAAAATAIIMETACAEINDVKEFTADEPFKYMILTNSDSPELLFYGQLVE
jgi:serpin B